ncbi:MAG TPA: PHB depolymerase family esterase [Polyangiaceae bacterium]|nr:PHB depolymerase family esterase [Polyangiaceae bacterium]
MSTTDDHAARFLVLSLVLSLGACSSSGTPSGSGSAAGGAAGASPVESSGGDSSSGGATSGGASSSGGGPTGTGGALAAGGASGSGGDSTGVGGTPGAGGAGSSGGANGAGGAPVACPSTALAPGDTNASIDVGGTTRTYIRHVPTSYTGETPVPLVVDLHPLFGNGAAERLNSGYGPLSDQEGFVVVWPDGIDAAWNIGPCCTTSRTVDDEGFIRALVKKISEEACIDPKRVYATGYSMGGGLSHYLACNAADVFAAVAPSAFDLLSASEEPCAPSRPITVISFRGTADLIVPYAGGASNPPNGLPVTIHFQGAQNTFATWANLDGCTGSPTDAGNGCSTYSQCDAGVEVTLCTAVGGGHVTGDAHVGWEMLKRHPMP